MDADREAVLDTIVDLATRIASTSPDAAEPAMRIASLARDLRKSRLDKGALRDALATATVGSDMSDADLSATVERTVSASRDDPGG